MSRPPGFARHGAREQENCAKHQIKWNAPTSFYAGPMKPTNPKEYTRYLVVFNLSRKDCIRPVFPRGAKRKIRPDYGKAIMRTEGG
jgi:hypothetical protein